MRFGVVTFAICLVGVIALGMGHTGQSATDPSANPEPYFPAEGEVGVTPEDACSLRKFRSDLSSMPVGGAFPLQQRTSPQARQIPDSLAYSLVFRLIDSHNNDATKLARLRSYIRGNLNVTSEEDISELFRLAADFNRRIKIPDHEISKVKNKNHRLGHPPYSQADRQQLLNLGQAKITISNELIADIPNRISVPGRTELARRIQDHVKPKIRTE